MKLLQYLENLGLNDKEAKCYLALLPLHQATAYMVAIRSGLKKPTAYVILEGLVSKGFALKIPNQDKTFYIAKSPKECFLSAREKIETVREILPELMAMQNSITDKPKIYFFEGRDGIDLVDAEILKMKEDIISFTTPRFVKAEDDKNGKEYVKKRIKAGIHARVIGEMSKEILDLKSKDEKEMRETRMLPTELFSSDIELGECGGKIFISNYKKEFGIMLEDKDVCAVFKKVFEIVWNSEKIVE